ncbi:MAG: YicC family protein [Balneola sp.]|nr:YicC family protein [Balneola sp.]MBO6651965.1 YicC family protein [Balneola sp.]MBO6711800.1 YicC family protein [Balneola sp.]MBO6799994.1 YicC family protein [Balneola sp.]MBO6871239.1 YicC family protein [Balneola sp.]
MIISMTGFGRGEATENGLTATVEIKSLNSRYLDLSIRLPQRLQDKELILKELVQKTISRGKLNINVHVTESDSREPHIKVDEVKVKAYARILREVQEAAGIEDSLNVRNITGFGDVFITQEDDEEILAEKWAVALKALNSAVENLIAMRTQEGDQLKNDLIERIENIEANLKDIEKVTNGRVEEIRNKLRERIQQLFDDENFDKERLETEVAVIADKMDITEEIVRMRAHLKFFIEAIEQAEPAGRRLNFLTQEMNRELNTIGSKANDSEIAHHVVRSKETLEQIREQVQNVE